jgi:MFS family permease
MSARSTARVGALPPSPSSLVDAVVTAGTAHRPSVPDARKAALAAFLGSMLEYYDFFVYGSAAALVFPHLFFRAGDPVVASVLSLATFGIAYVFRPLGAVVLGHFGDRLGRKRVLVLTLLLMGGASFAIGVLPTYSAAGVLAPVLLLTCRIVQGFSAGGEAAGASTLTLEHSPDGRRGFFTSMTMAGFAAGMVLATLVFLPVAAMPAEARDAWGWRVPFLASVAVIIVAYAVRRRLVEPAVFVAEVKAAADVEHTVPARELMRTQPLAVARVVALSLFAVYQSLFAVYGLSYATSNAGLDKATMLWVSVAANAVAVVAIPFWAAVSDRVGRRPVWVIGAVGSALLLPTYLSAIDSHSYLRIFAVGTLFAGVVYSMVNGLWPAFFAELFAPRVRFSGFAIGTQLGFLLAGFAPALAADLVGTGGHWGPVALLGGECGLISAVAAMTAKETARTPQHDLGR